MWRWINPENFRYYQADLALDLLSDWTLVCCWGGLGSRRGGYRVIGVKSYADGLGKIDELNGCRRKRGYVAVGTFKDWALQIAGMRRNKMPLRHRQPNRCLLIREPALFEERCAERQTDTKS